MTSDDRLKMRAVEAGMAVHSPDGQAIGTVQAVYPAVADPNGNPLSDAEMTGQPVEWAKGESWADSLARLAELPEGETIPREEARRLVQGGFLVLEGGSLTGRDRLIACDEVADVRDDGVHLSAE
jgi:hypothetical protein